MRKYFWPLFPRVRSLVETVLGESSGSGLRTGKSTVFPMMDFSGSSSVNVPQVKNRLPRFAIQACSVPVGFEKEQSPDFFLQISVRRLLFVNSRPRVEVCAARSNYF